MLTSCLFLFAICRQVGELRGNRLESHDDFEKTLACHLALLEVV